MFLFIVPLVDLYASLTLIPLTLIMLTLPPRRAFPSRFEEVPRRLVTLETSPPLHCTRRVNNTLSLHYNIFYSLVHNAIIWYKMIFFVWNEFIQAQKNALMKYTWLSECCVP